jgi:hypothetical protein
LGRPHFAQLPLEAGGRLRSLESGHQRVRSQQGDDEGIWQKEEMRRSL